MKSRANRSGRMVGAVLGVFAMSACAGLPEISRTQAVHDVRIETGLSPADLTVAPGDEVRWVNLRKEPIFVQIAELDTDDLACHRGFDNWRGKVLESVEIRPNETVSLCFKAAATVLYNVRAPTAVSGGNLVLPGVVRVGADSIGSDYGS